MALGFIGGCVLGVFYLGDFNLIITLLWDSLICCLCFVRWFVGLLFAWMSCAVSWWFVLFVFVVFVWFIGLFVGCCLLCVWFLGVWVWV